MLMALMVRFGVTGVECAYKLVALLLLLLHFQSMVREQWKARKEIRARLGFFSLFYLGSLAVWRFHVFALLMKNVCASFSAAM